MVKMSGLRFGCVSGCTNCCDRPGFVYITKSDLKKAAKYLRISAAEFERKYVYRSKHRLRLRKPKDRQCPFLSKSGCEIHPAKPTQCRLFPFWPELVESRDAWKDTGDECPGIGSGRLYQIGTAVETASEMKDAYPYLY
jgi:uncharacterized protein